MLQQKCSTNIPFSEIDDFYGRGANSQFVAAILKLQLDLPFMGIWINQAFALVEI